MSPGSRRSSSSRPLPLSPKQNASGHRGVHIRDGNGNNSGRLGEMLRRGHSDGDVLSRGHRLDNSTLLDDDLGFEEETWMDFLSHRPDHSSEAQTRAQAAIRRAALVHADRKRRLSALQQDDYSRRRSASSLSFGYGSRTRQGEPSTPADHARNYSMNLARLHPETSNLDRPLPAPPVIDISHGSQTRDFVLPRWQPDAEVTTCPICGTSFSFWYRKHHCRKCGRVVCANCSPHRITIPRQFIVNPPSEAPSSRMGPDIEVVDLTSDNESSESPDRTPEGADRSARRNYRLDPALGGGQEVRLCNPCVPDPNPLPHPSYSPPTRYGYERFPGSEHSSHLSVRARSPLDARLGPALHERFSLQNHQRSQDPRVAGSPAFIPNFSRPSVGVPTITTPPTARRHTHTSRFQGIAGSHVFPSIYSSASGTSLPSNTNPPFGHPFRDFSHPHHRHHLSASNISHNVHDNPHTTTSIVSTAQPRPQLREEDECPICHSALPPKEPDGSETSREAHVQTCIETHFSTSAPSRPVAPVATIAAIAASAATPPQAGGSSAGIESRQRALSMQTGRVVPDAPAMLMGGQRRRTAGMVVYLATEKDCVGDDGEGEAECVICFEEFEVGDEMGRLECLCKFHKVCHSIFCRGGNADGVGLYTPVVGYERRGCLSGASRWLVSTRLLVSECMARWEILDTWRFGIFVRDDFF